MTSSATYSDREMPSASAEAYRRRARRVRATHQDRPIARYAALCELARRSDEQFDRLFGPAGSTSPADERRTNDVLDAILADLEGANDAHPVRVRRVASPRHEKRVIAALNLDADSAHSPAAVFAQEISEALDGDILRYSERQKLIRRAAALGLSRFDANVVIAMVQNRLGAAPIVSDARPPKPANPWLLPIAIAATLQISLVAGVLWFVSKML